MSTLSEIKRLQKNAAATLLNIVDYVNNATDAQLNDATIRFLTEDAEGAFNESLAAAKLLRPSFNYTKDTAGYRAALWMDSALKERAKK